MQHLDDEYSLMYRNGGKNHLYLLTMDPKSLSGFLSCRFTESMAFGEALGYNILDRYFLNSSFFISSKKDAWIFIFWISYSKLKE
jgi:hypothetical protein